MKSIKKTTTFQNNITIQFPKITSARVLKSFHRKTSRFKITATTPQSNKRENGSEYFARKTVNLRRLASQQLKFTAQQL